MLYYGGSAAGGLKAGDFITELHSRQDLQTFVDAQDDKVRWCSTLCKSCLKAADNVCRARQMQRAHAMLTVIPVAQVLTVIDVSLSDAAGCIRLFPAVLALAKSFKGFAAFARLLGDSNPETRELMKELQIQQARLSCSFSCLQSGRPPDH